MPDQADKLRKLVQDAYPPVDAQATLPPTILVLGGKGGVGTTTVALNLAVALSHGGHRMALVDLAPNADVAKLANVDTSAGPCLADVLAGDATAAQALRPGPAGVLLLANRPDGAVPAGRSERALERLVPNLRSLGDRVDTLVVDCGSGMGAATRRIWPHATLALIVATPDDVAVLDAYATIKAGWMHEMGTDVRVVLNQCDSARAAGDVHRRLATTCRRFLGFDLAPAPRLPGDAAGTLFGIQAVRTWERPNSAFARSIRQLGRFAADQLAKRSASSGAKLAPVAERRTLELCSC